MSGARVAVLLLLAVTTGGVCLADAGTAVAQSESRCDAADALAADGLLLPEAKAQYKKALDDPRERVCAVTGLMEVATAQAANKAAADMEKATAKATKAAADKKKKDDEQVVTLGEAVDAVVDWAGKVWPWVVGFAALCFLGYVLRLPFPSRRIAIRAAKADENFAAAVGAAASAAGGDGSPSPSIKVVPGGADALPGNTITDLSKLLALPSGVPLGLLLKVAAFPLAPSTLSVGWSAAGGWAVADLQLRRAWRRTGKARIALKLGSLDTKKQQEAVALVAGAWMVGWLSPRRTIRQVLMSKPKLTTSTRRRDDAALLAHAYFRAGANLQLRGEAPTALRCYEAMPDVKADVAPFAWVGSRLNAMVVLKAQKRIDEADAMAKAVAGVAQGILDNAKYRERFGRVHLHELRRRTAYLTAVLRVDLLAQTPGIPSRQNAALEAVQLLTTEIDYANNPGVHVDRGLLTAMRMVRICRAVLDPSQGGPPEDLAAVLAAGLDVAAVASPREPLGAAAYYDAACAYTVMAPQGAPATDGTIKNAFAMLALAAAATPASSRARMLATAQSDEMLKPLREPSLKACFDAALGVVAAPPVDANLAVTVTEAVAAA